MSDGQPLAAPLFDYLDDLARLGGAVSAIEVRIERTPEFGNGCGGDDEGASVVRCASGFRRGGERLLLGARFDAASLTKPWMATLALVLDAKGVLPLATGLAELFPIGALELGTVRLEELLRHRSGIAAWAPLAAQLGSRLADPASLSRHLLSESLWTHAEGGEAGSERYSDLGYILWGLAVERATGQPLAALLDRFVSSPLGLPPIGALSTAPPEEEVVECRLDNGKEVELARAQGIALARQAPHRRGVPQDGNARAIGRLSGHAGLFVTADEMATLGKEWLAPERLLSRAAVDRALAGGGGFALGWARQSDEGSSGPALERSAFGHTGFTGGSLWVEPERRRTVVVLAHRLASRIDFNPIRREIHRLAAPLGSPLS